MVFDGLSIFHKRYGQSLKKLGSDDTRYSPPLVLSCSQTSAHVRAVVIGLAVQASAAWAYTAFMKPADWSFSFWPRAASAERFCGVISFSIAWIRSGVVVSASPVMPRSAWL